MRVVNHGAHEFEIAGGALTPLAWYYNFNDDGLIDAQMKIERHLINAVNKASGKNVKADEYEEFPTIEVLKCAYVLAWTADYAQGRETLPFDHWLSDIGDIDVYTLAWEVSAEITAGIFRDTKKRIQKAKEEETKTRSAANSSRGRSEAYGTVASGIGAVHDE